MFADHRKQEREQRRKAFWPVMGFLLAVSSAFLAYVLIPGAYSLLNSSLRNFPPSSPTIQLIIGLVLFLVFVTIGSLLVALAVPKPKIAVTETSLMKERNQRIREHKARKVRQSMINREGKSR
jgi:hypothetical protein